MKEVTLKSNKKEDQEEFRRGYEKGYNRIAKGFKIVDFKGKFEKVSRNEMDLIASGILGNKKYFKDGNLFDKGFAVGVSERLKYESKNNPDFKDYEKIAEKISEQVNGNKSFVRQFAGFIGVVFIFGAFFSRTPNIVGYFVFDLNESSSNIFGVSLFVVGLICLYFYLRD